MLRPLTFSLLILAAARLATADETAMNTPAASAQGVSHSVEETKRPARRHPQKKEAADTKPAGDGKTDATAAASATAPPGGDVKMSGMSILGNEDAPKSLVLVPWKASQLGDMPSVSRLLDTGTQPVDKDVFMRELAYYEYKSGSK